MWRIVRLAEIGNLSSDEAMASIREILTSRPALGEIALRRGYLTMKQIFKLLGMQATSMEPLGKLAVENGMLTREQLAELILEQGNLAIPERDILKRMGLLETAMRLDYEEFCLASRELDHAAEYTGTFAR